MAIAYAMREFMRDLPYAGYDITTTAMTAMMIKSTWPFDLTTANISNITSPTNYEVTGPGYARTGSYYMTGTNGDLGISLQLSTTLTFATMSTTDWQYILLYNSSSGKPYFLLDGGQQNVINNASVALDNSPEPFLQLNLS